MDNQIAIPLGANEENFPNLAPLNNPPTMIDYERAQVYLDRIVRLADGLAFDGMITTRHVVEAHIYYDKVRAAYRLHVEGDNAAEAPPWAQELIAQVNAGNRRVTRSINGLNRSIRDLNGSVRDLNEGLNDVYDQLGGIGERLEGIDDQLVQVKVLSLRAIDYEAVPFPDGSMPGDPEYDLPPLTSAEAIRGLSARQVRDYFDLYHLAGVGLGVPRKRVAIARHVGCNLSVS